MSIKGKVDMYFLTEKERETIYQVILQILYAILFNYHNIPYEDDILPPFTNE